MYKLIISLMALASLGVETFADSTALFYALDEDLISLKAQSVEVGQPILVGTRKIHRLAIGIHLIYAIKMGSGPVETAASAQALLSRFRCDLAFSIGPAGALSHDLKTGAWHRISTVLAWQRGTAAFNGFVPAETARWKIDWARFPVLNCPGILQTTSTLVVCSGEVFIAAANERDRIQSQTQADAVDMNSFGLAVVCLDHEVPLFVWRIISDYADENAPEAFRAFVTSYTGEGGRAMADLISSLPPNPSSPDGYPEIQKYLNP